MNENRALVNVTAGGLLALAAMGGGLFSVGSGLRAASPALTTLADGFELFGRAAQGFDKLSGAVGHLGTGIGRFGTIVTHTIGFIIKAPMLLVGAFNLAASAIGLIFNPMALLSVAAIGAGLAVVGLGAYFLFTSDIGKKALAYLRTEFSKFGGFLYGMWVKVKADAIGAFTGIKDALIASDFKTALEIIWTTIKLEFARGVLGIWNPLLDGYHKVADRITDEMRAFSRSLGIEPKISDADLKKMRDARNAGRDDEDQARIDDLQNKLDALEKKAASEARHVKPDADDPSNPLADELPTHSQAGNSTFNPAAASRLGAPNSVFNRISDYTRQTAINTGQKNAPPVVTVNVQPAGTVSPPPAPATPNAPSPSPASNPPADDPTGAAAMNPDERKSHLGELQTQRAADQKALADAFNAKRSDPDYQTNLADARQKVRDDDQGIIEFKKASNAKSLDEQRHGTATPAVLVEEKHADPKKSGYEKYHAELTDARKLPDGNVEVRSGTLGMVEQLTPDQAQNIRDRGFGDQDLRNYGVDPSAPVPDDIKREALKGNASGLHQRYLQNHPEADEPDSIQKRDLSTLWRPRPVAEDPRFRQRPVTPEEQDAAVNAASEYGRKTKNQGNRFVDPTDPNSEERPAIPPLFGLAKPVIPAAGPPAPTTQPAGPAAQLFGPPDLSGAVDAAKTHLADVYQHDHSPDRDSNLASARGDLAAKNKSVIDAKIASHKPPTLITPQAPLAGIGATLGKIISGPPAPVANAAIAGKAVAVAKGGKNDELLARLVMIGEKILAKGGKGGGMQFS